MKTRIVVALAAFIGSGVPAWAQAVSTAQIVGTVQDASGLVVPRADIKATQTDTGLVRTAVSAANGAYVLPSLPVGPWSIEVTKEGFAKYVQTGIVLQVATNPAIDVVLKVGTVSEQVQVEANAAMVETQSTGVGQVIENQRILELPLNGRQATDLIQLAGAAVPQGTASSRSMNGGQAISVAGGQAFSVTYMLDGANHNNTYDNLNLPLPFPDALQEFKVETSTLTAQNGIHPGAAVNAVTKSGTNGFHGDAFEFVRNGDFNARNFFAARRDTLKRNQFGGTVGGPIMKNKLFAFAGYQRTTTRQDPTDTTAFVPTADMLAGDFTAITSPACNTGRQINLAAPFVDNRISPTRFSPAALKIAERLPQTSNPCGRTLYGSPVVQNENQIVGRVDYQRSSKQSIFGRYLATTFATVPPFSLSNNILTTTTGGRDNLSQSITLGDTYLAGPGTINSFRASVNRTAIQRTAKNYFSAPDIGVANSYSYLPNYMIMSVTGGPAIGSGIEDAFRNFTSAYQLGNDVSLVRGSHQFAFGASAALSSSIVYSNVRSPGVYTFDGSATGLGMADFLIGALSLLDVSAPNTLHERQWYVGAYGQDTWKLSSRFTLNYGVRWEPFLPQVLADGAVYNFDYGRYQQGVYSTVFKNAPAGFYYPGDPGFPGKSGLYKHPWNFAPRVGLAWDPAGDGRTSVRASYGLAYDFFNGQFFQNSTIAPPWGTELRIPSPTGGFDNPWLGVPGGNPFPLTIGADAIFPPGGPFLALPYNLKTTSINTWNLAVQRQIGTDWLLSATYVGSETNHLWTTRAQNPGVFLGLGACTINGVNYTTCSNTSNLNQRRLFSLQRPKDGQYIGYMDIYDDGANQSYNGLILSVQRRARRGVSFNGNYAWSHCIGDPNGGGTLPNVGTNYLDPNNRRFDRGNCTTSGFALSSDRRHIANLTVVAETPRFGNNLLRAAATGWKLSGIYTVRSGGYLTITTNLDRQLSGTTNQRPNQVLANVYGNGTPSNYLNPAAFALPAPGTLGNMGRAQVLGPGFWEIDLALSRAFRIREQQTFEIRGEAFNVTNSFRAGTATTGAAVTTNVSSNTFGQILNAYDPRIMQFALKYVF
jgi:hypothetical protein